MADIREHNKKAQDDLLDVLENGNALLMVGAGCSIDLGYPDWNGLQTKMHQFLAPGLEIPGDLRPEVAMDLIKEHCRKSEHGLKPFNRFVEATLGPKHPICTDLHLDLARLGFAGAMTTNLDPALDGAVSLVSSETLTPSHFFNLCDQDHRYRVLDCLRAVAGRKKQLNHVLHLHGRYDKPETCVLTENDYRIWYDGAVLNDSGGVDRPAVPADTLHRKVIWTLLATHSLVFVGYGLQDVAFYEILQIWRKDFDLVQECLHFAIVGFDGTEESRASLDARYAREGISPLYYEVPVSRPNDHSGLHLVIRDLARARGVAGPVRSINDLTKGFLKL